MRSLNTNAVITRTPISSSPRGKNTSAPATTPTVPKKVTMLGVTPSRISRWARGFQTLVQKSRNLSSMVAAGYPLRLSRPVLTHES